jgi:uncharacterized membrane protein HdeD (DUF308 family)
MTAELDNKLPTAKSLSWLAIVFGVISLGIGIFFVVSPHETLSTFTVIAGIFLLIEGVLALLGAIFSKWDGRGVLAINGVLAVIAGLILIKHPFNSLIVFVMILGVWFVVAGLIRLIAAFAEPDGRGPALAVAAIDIVAGIAILAWPDLGLSTFAVIIGIVLILRGILFIAAGFQARKLTDDDVVEVVVTDYGD